MGKKPKDAAARASKKARADIYLAPEIVLADVIEHVNQGLSYFDRDLNLVCCNKKYLDLLEFPEWMGAPGTPAETFLRFNAERGEYGEGDVDLQVEERLELVRRFEPHAFERERPDGIILRIEGAPIENGGFVTTYTDVTALRRSEQALQRANEELDERVRARTAELLEREAELRDKTAALETVLEAVTNGITMVDGNLHMKLANSKAAEVLNLPPRLLAPGEPFEDIMRYNAERGEYGPGDPEEQTRQRVEAAARFEPHHFTRERPDGSYIEVRGEPVADGFVTTYTDVTEQKRAEKVLREANAELEQRVAERTAELQTAKERAEAANRAKSDFLAQMSHELRTPLNSILGYSDTIRQELFGPVGTPKYAEYLDAVHNSGTHLLHLINDILEIARVDSGKITLENETVDVAESIESALIVLKESATKMQHRMNAVVPKQFPSLSADPRRLHQMLLNLLSNAIKFTPSGGEIWVVASTSEDDGINIAVTDDGPGISDDEVAKVVEPFTQTNAGLLAKEGSGLGLSIVDSFMREHGGRLTIESCLGEGTTMTLSFPPRRTV